VTNLLVLVCHTPSHFAYGATRFKPSFMVLGGAAGYTAAYTILDGNIDVQAVSITGLQSILLKDGVLFRYQKRHCDG